MRAERLATAALLTAALLAGLASGCVPRVAPHGWLPAAAEAQTDGYGGWIAMTAHERDRGRTAAGELLAISTDSVFVLADSTVVGWALADLGGATLEGYDPETRKAASWTTGGAVFTITHGWGLIVTAPLWVIVGGASTGALSYGGRLLRPQASWADMRLFARFPQGLPPGLDRATLKPRPFPWRKVVPPRYDPRSITNPRTQTAPVRP